jgi:hypothetical protein
MKLKPRGRVRDAAHLKAFSRISLGILRSIEADALDEVAMSEKEKHSDRNDDDGRCRYQECEQ